MFFLSFNINFVRRLNANSPSIAQDFPHQNIGRSSEMPMFSVSTDDDHGNAATDAPCHDRDAN